MGASLDVAKAWVDACDRGELDEALALCDPEIELVEAKALPGAVTSTGIDAVRRYLDRFSAHWSEVGWKPEEFREAGDKVYMRGRMVLTGARSGSRSTASGSTSSPSATGSCCANRGTTARPTASRRPQSPLRN